MTTRRAVIYCRVSTDKQGETGLGIEAQRAAAEAYLVGKGWVLAGTFTDVASGKSTDRRPQLAECLDRLQVGWADVLIVAKLDRLSRSLVDFAQLMSRSKQEGWGIVALDIGVDTGTLNGELVANIIMALAQWERQLIGQRVKAALDIVVERGGKLGRKRNVSPETVAIILEQRQAGRSFRQIATALDDAMVPTPQGSKNWQPSTIQKLCRRAEAGDA